MLPDDILLYLGTFLPWKTMLLYIITCKKVHMYLLTSGAVETSLTVGCKSVLRRFQQSYPRDYKHYSKYNILKLLYMRDFRMNRKAIKILQLYRNYSIFNKILNEPFQIWSPVFETSQIGKNDDMWLVHCSNNILFQKLIQKMTLNIAGHIPFATSVIVKGCYYPNEVDRIPPTSLDILDTVKIYAQRFTSKRGRDGLLKNNIQTRYYTSPTQYTRSFHAMQSMDITRGRTARVFTSFKLCQNPCRTWEWIITCTFDKIDIYCY